MFFRNSQRIGNENNNTRKIDGKENSEKTRATNEITDGSEQKIRKYTKDDEEILTVEEQEKIVEWARKNYTKFKPNGINRWRCILSNIRSYPEVINIIKQRIVQKEGLENFLQEPTYKDALSYMTHGAKLHEHIDPNQGELLHIRFNVYVQLPQEGGYPIYANRLHKLKERTYICCRAGLDRHSATEVLGERERVMISFGFLMTIKELGNVIYEY